MSEEKPNVPKLRFPGFTDPWEQRKFSEIATLRRGLTYSPNDITDKNGGVRVLRSSNISGDQFELHDDDVFVREDAVKIAPAEDGDILITAANGSSNLVGKRARICNLPGKTVHGGFMLLASTGDSYYLNAAMGAQWYRRFLHMGVAGGNGALGNLDMKALLDYELLTPSRNERKKIGSLFNRLDSLITLHQRKLDHLKEMKKGLLQKMFPKNGESIPELRFPGFTDPWEQRKFSEIATLRRGLTYSPNDITDKNGGVRVLRSSNISGDQFELHDDDVFVREDAVKIAPAEDGDILITAANGSSNLVGKRARICNLPGKTVHGGFMLLASTGDSYYLNAAMGAQWYRRFLHMGVAGGNGALGNLDMKALLDYELLTPSRNERKKIGSLFNRLDSLITLHQRKLDHLKEMKKGLLQQMFV